MDTYEKKYKNALEWARQVMNGETGFIRKEVEEVFPELAESEDERLRKEIISALKYANHKGVYDKHIAWLEKQGEPFDKEKVLIGARKDVALSIINYLDNNSVGMWLSNMECEDIEDACINSKWTKLYNYMKKKLEKQGDKPFDYENANIQQKDFAPKSQRMVSAKAKEALYGKPAWSEEDERLRRKLIELIYSVSYCDERENLSDWLKSLKTRYTWKPSDEQMRALHDMNLTGNISYAGQGQTLIELYNDLKKLKEE